MNGEPPAAPTTVMLSLSKHDPDHRTLPASDTTIAASAVMLRQAQHDGTRTPLCPTLSLTTGSVPSVSTRRGQGTPNPTAMPSRRVP
ncbi:MAG: hypothetical protein AMXMBFR61_14120 [Fimbriimonadales bacterium]